MIISIIWCTNSFTHYCSRAIDATATQQKRRIGAVSLQAVLPFWTSYLKESWGATHHTLRTVAYSKVVVQRQLLIVDSLS